MSVGEISKPTRDIFGWHVLFLKKFNPEIHRKVEDDTVQLLAEISAAPQRCFAQLPPSFANESDDLHCRIIQPAMHRLQDLFDKNFGVVELEILSLSRGPNNLLLNKPATPGMSVRILAP